MRPNMGNGIESRLRTTGILSMMCLLSSGYAADDVHQYPLDVYSVTGSVVNASAGCVSDGSSVTFSWESGEGRPVVVYDYGGRTVGGYAVFNVTGFKAQGVDERGLPVGYPVLRLSYCTHPDGLRETGDFTRRKCISYLGKDFDNPVLPANVNRFELYTICRNGTYVAPLLQGQERYVRVQLETPGTEVSVDAFEIRNVGVHSRENPVGSFRCSDERVNRAWDMSAWTCKLASIPNGDAFRVVDGRLLPRKLMKGSEVGLCEKAFHGSDGEWTANFELRTNPHFDSAFGMMLRAKDEDNGLVVVASQPAVIRVFHRCDGANRLLRQKVLDAPIIDGMPCRLTTRVATNVISVAFNDVDICDVNAPALGEGGGFGFYTEKEWWPVVADLSVKDSRGREVFREDFSSADDEGRLPGWSYSKAFKYMADGAKRDRLVWIGDLWWAARTCFCAYPTDWPYFRESLKLLAFNQTPEGYVWSAPYAETQKRPGSGEYGHFPSDQFSAWLSSITWEYYLHTADEETMKTLYPAVQKDISYLTSHCREDGLFVQRIETSSNIASMPPNDVKNRLFTQVVLWKAYVDGAKLAKELGQDADRARWEGLAVKLAAAIRKNFWNEELGGFDGVYGVKGANAWTDGLTLATEFATRSEALRIAKRLPDKSPSKGGTLAFWGLFKYGLDEEAFRKLEGGNWFALSDPQWAGAQCCMECGFLTRDGWWDESHPDTAIAGQITNCILGVEPLSPGFARFGVNPHFVKRIGFAEGKVPTPYGFIGMRWERREKVIVGTLEVPDGTIAEVVDHGEKRELPSGCHTIEWR